MTFTPIKNILSSQLSQKTPLKGQILAGLVCESFDKWVLKKWGGMAENKVKAIYFKKDFIAVACLSSVVAQEIKLHEHEILEFLNLKYKINIKSLKFLA